MLVETDECRSSYCKDVRSRVIRVNCDVTTHPPAASESVPDGLEAEPTAGQQPAGRAIRHKPPLSPPMRGHRRGPGDGGEVQRSKSNTKLKNS